MRRVLPLCLAALALAGCSRDEVRVVGVVPKGANHIFWQTVHAGAVKAARENNLTVEWNAPSIETDSSRQIAILDSMVNRRLAGIAVAPVDRKALINVVERASAAGIPVAIYDSGIDTDKRIAYIATNNREGGRMAARKIGELCGGEGKVAVIGFMPGSASTMEREEGFSDELKARYPKMQIVQMVFGMADRAKARASTENILNAHPDLKAIFADNESSSAGAVMALRSIPGRDVHMVAFDANEQLITDLGTGLVDGLVIQDPFRMGYESVLAIAKKMRGEPVAPGDGHRAGAALHVVDRVGGGREREPAGQTSHRGPIGSVLVGRERLGVPRARVEPPGEVPTERALDEGKLLAAQGTPESGQ